jgi:CheY-like chemotaxis protein
MGFEVDSAANGLLALEKLNQKPFDLVLMDLYMPVMGGQACAKQIRQTPKLANIPIIGMTATGFAEDRNE